MTDTKKCRQTKYEIPDDHVWADEQQPDTEDLPPVAEVTSHSVEILHCRREHTTGRRDIRYRYLFEDGDAIGIFHSHRLAESNQFDPMGAVSPYEVPAVVRQFMAKEMGADRWTDIVDVERAEQFAGADG